MDRDKGKQPAQEREQSGELLGPYTLHAVIARGELTTVYFACKQGALGFQRSAAVKRLKPLFARQESYARLLAEEAQLAARLHHANIVGILDVGSEGGCYVVSDYVEGASLATLLARAGGERHPRYLAPIFVDALNGLHAAHTALDADEAPLGIVHQAPHARHILVGADGIGRITDFSQAKAHLREPSRLRSDRLELAYMAPEQALKPELVDHRADLFILGIALWEALTGERLFASDDEERSFQNLLHRRIPKPSEVGLRPPRCFDSICLRALERDPSARYASAHDMARELRDTALNQALYATAGDVGRWVRGLVGEKLLERRRKIGADSPSQIALLSSLSTHKSGYFEALTAAEDPYRSGRIYGGSFSMVDTEDGVSEDLDKTPALGMRGGRYGALPSGAPSAPQTEEPTARRGLLRSAPESQVEARGAAREQNTEPQERARNHTLPLGSAPVPTRGSVRPALEDPEHTQPNHFVPSRPGARRDSNVPSPGAYSQVTSPRRPRATQSSVPPAKRGSQPPPVNPFEELETGRFVSVPPLELGTPRLPAPAAGTRASSSPPAPSPSRWTSESESPLHANRQDSVPSRMSLPDGPVGSPHARPVSSFPGMPMELPKAAPVLEDLRPNARQSMFPPAATGTPLPSSVPSFPPPPKFPSALVSSLTPPDLAARTVPPAAAPQKTSRLGVVFLSGALAAVIVLAASIGARRWFAPPAQTSTAAAQPQLPAEPPVAPASGVVAPPPELPAAAAPQAHPENKVSSAHPAKAAGAWQHHQKAQASKLAPSHQTPSTDAPTNPPEPTAAQATSAEPAAPAADEKPVKHRAKPVAEEVLPENPY